MYKNKEEKRNHNKVCLVRILRINPNFILPSPFYKHYVTHYLALNKTKNLFAYTYEYLINLYCS